MTQNVLYSGLNSFLFQLKNNLKTSHLILRCVSVGRADGCTETQTDEGKTDDLRPASGFSESFW